MILRKTDKEISQRLETLKPLVQKIYTPKGVESAPITPPTKISNEAILQTLQEIYEGYYTLKTLNQRRCSMEETNNLLEYPTDFYKTTVGELNYRQSSTLFTPQFEKKIKNIMKYFPRDDFSNKDLIDLNERLQTLSKTEFEWKEYHRRTMAKEVSHKQFKQEFTKFDHAFNQLITPTEEELKSTRSERKFFKFKIGRFVKVFLDYLYIKGEYKSLAFCTSYSPEELGDIVQNFLESHRIFNDLARISIRKAHEKLLSYNTNVSYSDDVLSIERHQLTNDFIKTFTVDILYAIINFGESTGKIDKEVADILSRDIQIEIFYKNLLINIEAKFKKEYFSYIDLTFSILEAFVQSGFFSNVVTSTKEKISGKLFSTTQLILQDKLTVEVFRPFKFPNLVRSKTLRKKDVDHLIKPLINGKGDLTKSDSLVTALNISKSKPYKVNELLLCLCKKVFEENYYHNVLARWLIEEDIDLGTVHQHTLIQKEKELKDLKELNKSTYVSLRLANAVSVQFLKTFNKAIKFSNLLEPCGITKVESLCYSTAKHLDSLVTSYKIDCKYTKSRLFLAEQLKSLPIYVTDILCIRLRKYPREHWLSRTAGQLKHLIENFKARKLTVTGLVSLLRAYYQANPEKLNSFEMFIYSFRFKKKIDKKTLSKYFYETPLDFTQIQKPMYFMNLHLAILQSSEENYMTAVNVEVDQNASALVILSLVLRSRKMAETCNVIGGSVKVSPYDYIKSKVKEFFDEHLDQFQNTGILLTENQDVFSFICNSRNLHKYAIMCFCYNQTTLGRLVDFSEQWVKEFGFLPNNRQKKFLNRFATVYEDFVEFVYPKTKRKLEILKELVGVVCDEAPKLSIRTLDGEVINWAFYATSVKKRKYYDAVDRKHKSYSISTYKERRKDMINNMVLETLPEKKEFTDFPSNLQLDSRGMKRRFLSYLIHSIDASILRRIINKMKKEHKSAINHLHDCVILHPNDLETLYIVIKEIYSSPDIYNIIEFGVFEQIESSLSPEGKEKLNDLRVEFFSLTDDFRNDLANINPQHMYSLED